MTSQHSQPTGKYCECGRELREFKLSLGSRNWTFPVMCFCRSEKLREEKAKDEIREKQIYLDRLFKQSRLGKRFQDSLFGSYKVTDETIFIFKKVKNYAENFNFNNSGSVLLYGPPGTGKTTLSSALVNELIKKGITSIFVSVPDLFSQIIASYSESSNLTEEKILRGLTDCQLLVMDEIALRKPKEKDSWAVEKLYQIINSRYANMKATVFTTNCDLKELSIRLGTSTFSRIIEMSKGMTFDFSRARDWRMYNITNSKKGVEDN